MPVSRAMDPDCATAAGELSTVPSALRMGALAGHDVVRVNRWPDFRVGEIAARLQFTHQRRLPLTPLHQPPRAHVPLPLSATLDRSNTPRAPLPDETRPDPTQ